MAGVTVTKTAIKGNVTGTDLVFTIAMASTTKCRVKEVNLRAGSGATLASSVHVSYASWLFRL